MMEFPLLSAAIAATVGESDPNGTATLDAGYAPLQIRMDAELRKAGYREDRDWITRSLHDERARRARLDVPPVFLLGQASGTTQATSVSGVR